MMWENVPSFVSDHFGRCPFDIIRAKRKLLLGVFHFYVIISEIDERRVQQLRLPNLVCLITNVAHRVRVVVYFTPWWPKGLPTLTTHACASLRLSTSHVHRGHNAPALCTETGRRRHCNIAYYNVDADTISLPN